MNHLLLSPDALMVLTQEAADDRLGVCIFYCESCSDLQTMVYHNIEGHHLHASAADLRTALGEVDQAELIAIPKVLH